MDLGESATLISTALENEVIGDVSMALSSGNGHVDQGQPSQASSRLFLCLEALLGCLTRLFPIPHFLARSDPKWEDCFVPVMREAISALSCLISGDLFDKLLQSGLITADQYELLTHVKSDVAREVFKMLSCRPRPSFDNFCSVMENVDGGDELLRILAPQSLRFARKSGQTDSTTLLIDAGADVNNEDTVCDFVHAEFEEVVLQETDRGSGDDCKKTSDEVFRETSEACGLEMSKTDSATLLIDAGADVNNEDTVCDFVHPEFEEVVLQETDRGSGDDCKKTSDEVFRETSEACGLEMSKTDSATLLIDAGADVNNADTVSDFVHAEFEEVLQETDRGSGDYCKKTSDEVFRETSEACGLEMSKTDSATLLIDAGADVNNADTVSDFVHAEFEEVLQETDRGSGDDCKKTSATSDEVFCETSEASGLEMSKLFFSAVTDVNPITMSAAEIHKPRQKSFDETGNGEDEVPIISGFQASPRKGGHIVVAIDIGTNFSTYACSFSSSRFDIFAMRQPTNPYGRESSPSTAKIPTTLLLTPDLTFHSFGHQAMHYYNRELDEDEQKRWFYFERFKKKLQTERNFSRQTSVRAANGREMPARTVFAFALKYFKDLAIQEFTKQSSTDISGSDFKWVITVPAIWRGGAKRTMREAAYEAGLGSEAAPLRLQFVSEPESASIYCKSMKRIGHSCNDEGLVTRAFVPGTTYVLADLGDDATDLTVYQVRGEGGFTELHHATGAWGGSHVDRNFVDFLEKVFGKDTIEKYKTEEPDDWVKLVTLFEVNKRSAGLRGTEYVTLPFSFHSFIFERGSSVEDVIAAQGNANLRFRRGDLAMKYPEVKKWFEPVLNNIAQHLETVIRKVRQVKFMILVGGFATCKLLQTFLHDRFANNLRIIIPAESSLAVVMGAVLFGHYPPEIQSRRLRYSYGIGCLPVVPNPKDPSLMMTVPGLSNRGLMFKTFVRKNQFVAVDEEVCLRFYPVHDDQTSAVFVVYESDEERTMHVSEEVVRKVAEFKLPMPNTSLGRNREIEVSMKFGQAEFKVHFLDMSSGERVVSPVKLDFLSVDTV